MSKIEQMQNYINIIKKILLEAYTEAMQKTFYIITKIQLICLKFHLDN